MRYNHQTQLQLNKIYAKVLKSNAATLLATTIFIIVKNCLYAQAVSYKQYEDALTNKLYAKACCALTGTPYGMPGTKWYYGRIAFEAD